MVKEFTPDMANSMQKIVRKCFPRTLQIVNKIHVFTLAYEAMRDLQIIYITLNIGCRLFLLSKDEKQSLNIELSREEIEYFFKPYPADETEAYEICNDFIKKISTDKSIL